jgi:hypothetical protein
MLRNECRAMQVESQQFNMTLSRASAGRPVGPSEVAPWFDFIVLPWVVTAGPSYEPAATVRE